MVRYGRWIGLGLLAAALPFVEGCAWHRCKNDCRNAHYQDGVCSQCGKVHRIGWLHHGCRGLGCRSRAIPDEYPLGSVMRAHFHQMQTNAEASDFVLHDHEFVGQSAELTPDGKDHLLEIAARMRSAPFPVLVERIENNADPELDAHRRSLIAQILTDLGNPDAPQRVIVAPDYGPGKQSAESQLEYWQYTYSGYTNGGFGGYGYGNGGVGSFGGFGGGFGGAGGGFF